ncbi:hypothetical protein ID866_6514 [Astraeus odoratus]|nr:hypothetical protein ID866_6514 [Astraeus odoratus]
MSVRGDAVSAYQSMTGAIIDTSDKTRRLTITPDQYNNLQTLTFVIGDQSYDLSPNAQIFARSSPNSQIFLVVRSSRPNAREDFSLGSPFFQRYYVVFNSSSSQIGFSSHLYTYSTTN